jgi:hypothetical protein
MDEKRRVQLGWLIWEIADEISTILWNRYERDFLEFCKMQEGEKCSDFKGVLDPFDDKVKDTGEF